MKDEGAAGFTGLVDLAADSFGGRALAATDEFFAEKENLLKPGRGVFLPDEYTERGKWMDGWESRRKRSPGHDHCIVELGAPGVIRGLDIDTNHFLGNHPPFASVDATTAGDARAVLEGRTEWTEILPQSPLRPGSQNMFAVAEARAFTHVRLNIFPDGGVARFRVYGEVRPTWTDPIDSEASAHLEAGEVDLAAVRNGAIALACSDAFFGPMNNLISPGRAVNMGGGWETRRRRAPGHDWIVVRLGAPGQVGLIEIDTNHFKGNFPDRFSLDGILASAAVRITDLVDPGAPWREILGETRLSADTRHFFRAELRERGPFSHVRLRIHPDGGVSRLRVYGRRSGASS
jgi:allantoicase